MTDTVDNEWDADRYDSQTDFVAAHGESLLDRLDPQPGERVLDLGCGTGELTAEIGRAVGPEGEAVVAAVEDRLGPSLFDADAGEWTVDYRRLRFVAVR
jgi:trans-aconitate methyltransferase